MKKPIVIYSSKRGSTKQYAEWIAEELSCEAVSFEESYNINLYEYDFIIYGGWIRGSGIVDFDKFTQSFDDELLKRLIVFGVGIANPSAENYMQVWSFSIGKIDSRNEHKIILYLLEGTYDPGKVTGLDKFLMFIMKKVLISGSTKDSMEQARKMQDRIERGIDLVKRENIDGILKDTRKILNGAK
ncbi:MAG TPA: hypothetical protein GX736_05720 [Mogibacterium sp.]|nr:hypothetical protein [Mogibacterium sp.]